MAQFIIAAAGAQLGDSAFLSVFGGFGKVGAFLGIWGASSVGPVLSGAMSREGVTADIAVAVESATDGECL